VIRPAAGARTVRDPSPGRNLVFGMLLGVPVSLASVLLVDSLNNTVRSKGESEAATGAPVLAVVPFDSNSDNGLAPRLVSEVDPVSPVAEAYRTLRHNLELAASRASMRTVLITSPGPLEGKTTVAANLALAYVDAHRSVDLVDAHLRRPRAYALFDAKPEPGLREVLTGVLNLRATTQRVRPRMTFLAAGNGPDRPDRILALPVLRKLLDFLGDDVTGSNDQGVATQNSSRGNVVLIDGGPVLEIGEASFLAAAVDGVVLVLRAGSTSPEAAREAGGQLRRAGANLVGVVLLGSHSTVRTGRRRHRRLVRAATAK
jgi:Mrp family chromosome partitioning ATPase